MAAKARTHNNANILVLGESVLSDEDSLAVLEAWVAHGDADQDRAERHKRRIRKVEASFVEAAEVMTVLREDPEVGAAIRAEMEHEQTTLNLIASENYVSRAVREAQGSVMTNKYAEGYPARRWYNGCRYVDMVEKLAIDRATALFGADHANVQPHCGSAANMAVYFADLEPGDTILAMSLAHGGHLTHGHSVNFSGRLFNVVSYGVDHATERIDYAELERLAVEHGPKLIVAGASAYPRVIEFDRFREVADKVGAHLMVDMAHIAGLVAGGVHPSPVPYAEFVTSTTHKTLRGPRSGLVLCRTEFAADLDRQVFPGMQGGPQMHAIAAKAVCLHEAAQDAFRAYAGQIVANAQAMADTFLSAGCRLVSGGTDNHLMLLNVAMMGLTGKDAATALEKAGLIVNKNAIPFDEKSPFVTSGIRIGTPAMTTRGLREADVRQVAEWIAAVLGDLSNQALLARTREKVRELAAGFPVA
jgi:glycine hydroxymethyltransferase